MSVLSAAEIAARTPVWCALSELFLDTELDEGAIAAVAGAIRKANMTAPTAERVLREEVAPAFYSNLLSVAGEWAGWREDFVRARIAAHLAGPLRPLRALPACLIWPIVRADWARFRAMLEQQDG